MRFQIQRPKAGKPKQRPKRKHRTLESYAAEKRLRQGNRQALASASEMFVSVPRYARMERHALPKPLTNAGLVALAVA